MAVAQRGLTLEEFLRLPEADEKPYLEYIDGEVVEKVSPKGPHSALQPLIAELFNQRTRPDRLALAFTELRTTFAGSSRLPDVSVYRWERIPRTKAGKIGEDFFEPPDIVIEIVSPTQNVNGLIRRCLWFVDNGVRVALLVDPDDESVIALRPNQPMVALRGDDQLDLSDVILGFQLTVKDVFAVLTVD